MITISKLNNSIVLFWGPRANEMRTEGRGAEDKGRESRVEEHKHPLMKQNRIKSGSLMRLHAEL